MSNFRTPLRPITHPSLMESNFNLDLIMASQGGPSRAPLTPSQGIVSSTAAESRSAWFYFRSAREGERQKDGIRTILYCSMCEDPKYGTAHITNAKNHLTRRHQLDFLRTPAATATRAQLVANSLSNGTPRPRAPRINTTAGGVLSLFSLEGQLAVVTGGTRGIGQAMAIALAEAGADIILVQVRRSYSQYMNA
jgi:hypothetical protein